MQLAEIFVAVVRKIITLPLLRNNYFTQTKIYILSEKYQGHSIKKTK